MVLLLVTGCAVFSTPHPHGERPRDRRHASSVRTATSPPILDDGYEDYVGVIHIHTHYSDGAGTFEDIARVANAQRLNYLITTDHNTLKPLRDGRQGWYGTTLILVGTELSTRGGHYLALNVTEEIDRHKLTTQQIIDEVNRQGGLGFIAHPYFAKRRWTDWTVTGFTGIEAYNVAHDTLDENRMRLVIWTLTVPAEPFYFSILDRPYDPLSAWDAMCARHGRVVGIGASDAHEVRVLGVKFAPYEAMFQLIRTHVLIPSTSLEPEGIYDALRQGHAYFAIELTAEAKGFSFMAEDGDTVLGIMGDEVPLAPALSLSAELSTPAQLTLFRDGQPIAASTGQRWRVPVAEAGAYRLEASRHAKPWIFSNPIYVRPQTTDHRPQTAGGGEHAAGSTPHIAPSEHALRQELDDSQAQEHEGPKDALDSGTSEPAQPAPPPATPPE